METLLWLLVLFVVVFFANLARRNKMIKRLKASGQLPETDQPESPQQSSSNEGDTRQ